MPLILYIGANSPSMDAVDVTANAEPLISIELTNVQPSVKALYYTDGKGSLFTYKPTRNSLLILGVLLLLICPLYLLSLSDSISLVVLLVLAVIVAISCLVIFLIRARIYLTWQRSVEDMLQELAKCEKYSMRLFPNTLEVTRDNEMVLEKWDHLTQASIYDNYIFLNWASGARYIFPAASMEDTQYARLKEIVHEKMNKGD